MSQTTEIGSPWQDLEYEERMSYLLKTSHLADCSFIVGSGGNVKTFLCHQLILACASPVFERMWFGDFKESNCPYRIPLEDVEPDDFEDFLQFVYRNKLTMDRTRSTEDLINLYFMGDRYLVSNLCKSCIKTIQAPLENFKYSRYVSPPKGLIKMFEFAHKIGDKQLIESTTWILQNVKVESIPELFQFESETFIKYLEATKNLREDIDKFYLIEKYIKANQLLSVKPCHSLHKQATEVEANGEGDVKREVDQDPKENTVDLLLNLIKFEKMTPKQFSDGPGKSDLLNLSQKYKFLEIISQRY